VVKVKASSEVSLIAISNPAINPSGSFPHQEILTRLESLWPSGKLISLTVKFVGGG